MFNLRSGHRYGIVTRIRSPSHPEEVEAASTEATQGHLLHVEQAEYGLDKAEQEEWGAEPELRWNCVELCLGRANQYTEEQGDHVRDHSTPVLKVVEYGEAIVGRAD